MPIPQKDAQKLLEGLQQQHGLPAAFPGDRLAAFSLGLHRAVEEMAKVASLDRPKEAAEPAGAKD